jgi:hypothetical protein
MSEAETSSPDLVKLLMRHRDEIVASWAEKLKNIPDTSYQPLTLEVISTWLSQELALIIEILNARMNQALEARMKEIALSHLQAGFSINEVTSGLLLSKAVIMPIIWSSYPDGSKQTFESIAQLDTCLCSMIGHFEQLFSETMHYQLVHDARQQLAESESLRRTMAVLLQKLYLDEVLDIVCTEACRLTGSTGSTILLLEEGWLQVVISTGTPLPILERLPMLGSLAGMSIKQGTPLISNDPMDQLHAYRRNPDVRSLLVIPLSTNGSNIGVLDVVNKIGGFTEDDIRIMNFFAVGPWNLTD